MYFGDPKTLWPKLAFCWVLKNCMFYPKKLVILKNQNMETFLKQIFMLYYKWFLIKIWFKNHIDVMHFPHFKKKLPFDIVSGQMPLAHTFRQHAFQHKLLSQLERWHGAAVAHLQSHPHWLTFVWLSTSSMNDGWSKSRLVLDNDSFE